MVNKNWKSFVENKLSIFLREIEKEYRFQDKKFPNQTHTIEKWIVIIMEEIGEMSKEALEIPSNHLNFDEFYKEIIQAITLLIRLRYSIYTINLVNHTIII